MAPDSPPKKKRRAKKPENGAAKAVIEEVAKKRLKRRRPDEAEDVDQATAKEKESKGPEGGQPSAGLATAADRAGEQGPPQAAVSSAAFGSAPSGMHHCRIFSYTSPISSNAGTGPMCLRRLEGFSESLAMPNSSCESKGLRCFCHVVPGGGEADGTAPISNQGAAAAGHVEAHQATTQAQALFGSEVADASLPARPRNVARKSIGGGGLQGLPGAPEGESTVPKNCLGAIKAALHPVMSPTLSSQGIGQAKSYCVRSVYLLEHATFLMGDQASPA